MKNNSRKKLLQFPHLQKYVEGNTRVFLQLFIISLLTKIVFISILMIVNKISFGTWCRWYDGAAYIVIAKSFPIPYYPIELIGTAKWYPFYPLLIFCVAPLFHFNYYISSIILSILFSSLAPFILYKIINTFNEKIPFTAAFLFIFLPPKWFLLSHFPMAEPLYLFLILLSVLFYIEGKYKSLFVVLILLSLTKVTGILMTVIFFIAYLERFQFKNAFVITLVLFAPLSLQIYLSALYGFDLFPITFLTQQTWQIGDFSQPSGRLFSFPFHAFITGWYRNDISVLEKIYQSVCLLIYTTTVIYSFLIRNTQSYLIHTDRAETGAHKTKRQLQDVRAATYYRKVTDEQRSGCDPHFVPTYFFGRSINKTASNKINMLLFIWIGVFLGFHIFIYGGVHLLGFLGYNRLMIPAAPVVIIFLLTIINRYITNSIMRLIFMIVPVLFTIIYSIVIVTHHL